MYFFRRKLEQWYFKFSSNCSRAQLRMKGFQGSGNEKQGSVQQFFCHSNIFWPLTVHTAAPAQHSKDFFSSLPLCTETADHASFVHLEITRQISFFYSLMSGHDIEQGFRIKVLYLHSPQGNHCNPCSAEKCFI